MVSRLIAWIALSAMLLWSSAAPIEAADFDSTPENVQITAEVVGQTPIGPTNPTLTMSGYAAPNATITIYRDGTVISTAQAAAAGTFSVTLADQPTGQHIYLLSFTDEVGQALGPVTLSFNLTSGSNTIVTGIFPGPSIAIDKSAVKLGTPVTISGTTVPSSTVTLTVHSTTVKAYSTSSDAAGRWGQVVETTNLDAGTHVAQAQALTSNTLSGLSQEIEFVVNPQEKCDGRKTADLNCDGNVNLTDFSILLYFWKSTNPANARADINRDGEVNLTDFSIMLYQWTA